MELRCKSILKKIEDLQRELEYLKIDLMHFDLNPEEEREKPSLFGSVHGGDITEEMIEEVTRTKIPKIHDRIIVATAKFYSARILTKDGIILESGERTN